MRREADRTAVHFVEGAATSQSFLSGLPTGILLVESNGIIPCVRSLRIDSPVPIARKIAWKIMPK